MEEPGEKDECGYVLCLSFSSAVDLTKMIEIALKKDKEWRITQFEFFKKEVIDKASSLIDEEEDEKRKSRILLNEKSRLRAKKMMAEEKHPPAIE